MTLPCGDEEQKASSERFAETELSIIWKGLPHQRYTTLKDPRTAVEEINFGLVNKYWRHLQYAFVGSVPALELVVAFKYFFTPAVKYPQVNALNTVAVYFKNVIIAISVRCKTVRDIDLARKVYKNIYRSFGRALAVISNGNRVVILLGVRWENRVRAINTA